MHKEICEKVYSIIDIYKPKSYCEIGVHNGLTAKDICLKILKYHPRLQFFGYDLFDTVNKIEHNGKTQASVEHKKRCDSRLAGVKRKHKHFQYSLIEGLTVNTLVEQRKFGLVYIDGGHSYDTVMHDYNMVKGSKIILFDDYNLPGVKKAVDEIGKGYLLKEFDNWKKKVWVIIND